MKSPSLAVCIVAAVALLPATESQSADPEKTATPTADPMLGREPGDVRDDNGLKTKLVWCPPGFVTMEKVEHGTASTGAKENASDGDEADPKDEPAPKPRTTTITPVKVFLTKGYWLGKYEVTQYEWKEMMKSEPWLDQDLTKVGPDFPATFVSWNDASDFCKKLTELERPAGRLSNNWEYTLPTEAQWERACRARTETVFSFGDDDSKLGEYAWFRDNASKAGESYAHGVGRKKANPWGIHDMHGNACEWCRDIFADKLPGGRDPDVKPDE